MEISLSNVREIGYIKINNVFLPHKDDLLNAIKDISYVVTWLRVTRHTFLNYWCELESCDNKQIRGIKEFVSFSCPTIGTKSVDSDTKRKFKRNFETMWRKYLRVCDFTEFESKLILEVCLGLPILIAEKESDVNEHFRNIDITGVASQIEYVSEFFNALFLWSTVTQSESYLANMSYTLLDMLFITSLHNDADFVDLLGEAELFKVCKRKDD